MATPSVMVQRLPTRRISAMSSTRSSPSRLSSIARVPCWIDNSPSPFDHSLYIEVPTSSSHDQRPLCIAQGASLLLALSAAQATANARDQWSRTSSVDRLRILQQAANIFEKRRDTLTLYLSTELGVHPKIAEEIFNQTISEMARINSRFASSAFSNRHIAGLGPRPVPDPTTPVHTGATLVISSISLPLVVQTIANSLSSGRSLLLLASNMMPSTHHFIVAAFTEAGLPSGCLNKIHARPEDEVQIVEILMRSAAVQMVEVCDNRQEIQERLWELGRASLTHVVARAAATS